MYTLKLTELQAQYLLRLVQEDDQKQKPDNAYDAFGTLHTVKAKLEKVNDEIAACEEAMRDYDDMFDMEF